mmetsp:Transcript_4009/g.9355  ORF Transcript_4009/g.9355 Transcript_4009/m.9355 type:complete len:259 (+) Transcript_4009:26-802(+)
MPRGGGREAMPAAVRLARRDSGRCALLGSCASALLLGAAATFIGGAWPAPRLHQAMGHHQLLARPAALIDEPPADYDTVRKELPIVKYPHPALRRTNAEVEVFDEKLHLLAVNLFDAMYRTNDGVGLAAPQVGVNIRMMVYNPDLEDPKARRVLVNPRIIEKSPDMDVSSEGCLSFPGMNGDVRRPTWVVVQAQNIKGETFETRIEGFEARLFQHEYDHLDGVVYIDHLTPNGREKVQPVLDRLEAEYLAAGGEEPSL